MTTAIDFSLEDIGFVENLTLSSYATSGTGNELNNVLTGNDLDNLLSGLAGRDTLLGGGGSDTLLGGAGDDWYRVDAADVVLEWGGAGFDTVETSVTHTLAANVEALVLTGGGAVSGAGNSLSNLLEGNRGSNALHGRGGDDFMRAAGGADTLNGGAGDDTMDGGAGNDTYIVEAVGDIVTEALNQGMDLVQSSVSITKLTANVENLRLAGAGDLDAKGNALGNVIWTNAGGNVLIGGAGSDTLSYEFGAVSGVTVSLAVTTAQATGGSGSDTLSGFERLTGSRFADDLTGDGGRNVLTGLDGNDAMAGGAGNDNINGGNGRDMLFGGSGADTLAGGAGNDTLNGGIGNDTYLITDLDDVVNDAGGYDTVIVAVDGYEVPSSIENVVWHGGAELAYFVDALYAGTSWGGLGEPVTVTYGFLTSPTGGAYELGANDFQPMTSGQEDAARTALAQWSEVSGIAFVEQTDALEADIRFGTNEQPASLGYAYYPRHGDVYIDNDWVTPYVLLHEIGHAIGLKHPGDYASEAPYLPEEEDARTNTVMSYNGEHVDELGAFDVAAIQYLYGVNPGARAGNDTYLLSGSEYIIWDGSGTDTVSATGIAVATHIDLNDGRWSWVGAQDSSILAPGQYFIGYRTAIENAIGGSAADTVIGNELANLLYGGTGNDKLDGGKGSDTLIGGAGRDRIDFTTALRAEGNVDTLIEFNAADDTIRLDNDVFRAFATENEALAVGAFHIGGAAHDATDRIIYDDGTGNLYYDADGTGAAAAKLFATLAGAPAVTAADFFIVA